MSGADWFATATADSASSSMRLHGNRAVRSGGAGPGTNPAVERMLGYSREELRGMHFRDFTHPEDVDQDVRHFEELVDGKRESYELEVRYLGKGGGYRMGSAHGLIGTRAGRRAPIRHRHD